MSENGYRLLDFGSGKKLEQFGNRIVQRESPSVGNMLPAMALSQWKSDGSFSVEDKSWDSTAEPWECQLGEIRFELQQTQTGQVGVFPEQAVNWKWIDEHAQWLKGKRAINLFAYTGGTTIALARAGAQVVHVDSARSVVNWARRNAERNDAAELPIRWIVEDAMTFLNRELRRGNQYDIFVADPPSFGRGTKKETWKFDQNIELLLDLASQLCADPTLVLVSGHTPGWDGRRLQRLLMKSFAGAGSKGVESGGLGIECVDGRELPSGCYARLDRSKLWNR